MTKRASSVAHITLTTPVRLHEDPVDLFVVDAFPRPRAARGEVDEGVAGASRIKLRRRVRARVRGQSRLAQADATYKELMM